MYMEKMEIIAHMAKEQMVEKMVKSILHQNSLSVDMQDLVQMIYLILLEYDDKKIVDLWTNKQMTFFLARIIMNQNRSDTSAFHYTIRRHQCKSVDIQGMDFVDEN